MLASWYASSPEHGGNPELTAANPPPSSSPHFRPTMQSPGPPYQSTMGSAMNYSERPYENQMVSHCQTNSYPSYQPPSPYRPHPVSPPAHQYGHQMHGGLGGYGSPYASAGPPQSHYGAPDVYGGRPPPSSMYGGARAAMQQMKAAWGGDDLMQYGGHQAPPSSRPMMPPPPSMHHSPPPPHYRQIPIVSGGGGGPPSPWGASPQIPSPGGMLQPSPRATPSPLPPHSHHSRSPSGHFSPPPAAPSPQQQLESHLQSAPMTPHPPPHKTTPSPPSGAATPGSTPVRQPICGSPANHQQAGGNSDPLQSLQKMVMLDSETVESPITRANYEMAANNGNPQGGGVGGAGGPGPGGHPSAGGRPASYFSVEQLTGGSDPGSPYPTYYNLDQNRLCTPPRTCMSTPTSSTFSSAPDSTSSNSPRSDSRTTTASADSSNHVAAAAHVNGDINNPHAQPPQEPLPPPGGATSQPPPTRRPDFESFGVAMTNGTAAPHPAAAGEPPATLRGAEDMGGGPVSSDSENKDTQDFLQHLGSGGADMPGSLVDGTVDLRRKSPIIKSPRGGGLGGGLNRRRVFGHDLQCDPLMDNSMDMPRNKTIMMSEERRNSTLPEFEITNGKPESVEDVVYPSDGGYTPRPPRYYSPTDRWSKMGPLEDGFMGMQQPPPQPNNKLPYPDDCLSSMPKPKRGRRKKMFEPDGIVSEWDMYNSEMVHHTSRPPRVSRGGTRGRRGSRRRGGVSPITSYSTGNGELPMDMYSPDASMLSMRGSHPGSNGMGDLMGDKDMPWSSHNSYPPMGPPPGMGSDYKESMSVIKQPQQQMLDSSHTMDASSMSANMGSSNYPGGDLPPPPGGDDRNGPRGSLLFKDVKMQQQQQDIGSQQYYDPVMGQLMPQPVKKKRGRPFGSKNKPKPPGEERQPRRRRKKEVFFGPEGPPQQQQMHHHQPQHHVPIIKRRVINGPYVHIVGIRNKPLIISVVNAPPKDDESEAKYLYHQKQQQFAMRQKLMMSGSSPSIYDGLSKDRSWLCSLCCKNSHYRMLGDLFGPYYLNGDQKPSSPAPSPSPTFGPRHAPDTSDDEDEESRGGGPSPTPSSSEGGGPPAPPRFPGKRKSDVMEQMFRAALLRKAKQANGQKSLEEMAPVVSDLMGGGPFGHDEEEDSKEFWVHEQCAIWSKSVYLFGNRLRGLEDTVVEAVEKQCSRCKFPGASLSCASENCPELYHYLCARDNWCHMDDENYTIYCPMHK